MSKNDKIILCFFGVLNRSIRYTYESIHCNMISILKENFDVDIYVFNNNVEDVLVDSLKVNNDDCKIINVDFFKEEKQTYIDSKIQEIKKEIKRFRYDYPPGQIQNALRQMYSEEKVGLFLENNINKYKAAVVCGPDYYLMKPINVLDIKKCFNNKSSVFTTIVNVGQGYTNGFYIGNLLPISKILKRYSLVEQLLPTNKDYEYLLKRAFEINNIENHVTDMIFIKIRNNKKIARQGIFRSSKFDMCLEKLKKTLQFE